MDGKGKREERRGTWAAVDARWAWQLKYQRAPEPWSGPVHAAAMLADLPRPVVELGAGGGKVGDALPADALALDWVREALVDAARPRVLADARAPPFRDASLGAIAAVHVLGHLVGDDRVDALAAWRRAVRPGGVLVLEVFATGDAREGAGRPVEEGTWEREGIPTHYFAAEELTGLLAGFEGRVLAEERVLRWGTRRVLRGRFVRA